MCPRRLEVGSLVYAPAAFSLPARPRALPRPTVERRVSVGATGVRAPSLCGRSHYLLLSRSLHLPPACTRSCAHRLSRTLSLPGFPSCPLSLLFPSVPGPRCSLCAPFALSGQEPESLLQPKALQLLMGKTGSCNLHLWCRARMG